MSEASHTLVRRGLMLMTVGTPESVDRALALFDRAIALRRQPTGDSCAAFDLAGAWMNRAEALLSRNHPGDVVAAVNALDQAIPLLEPLLSSEQMPGTAIVLRRLAVACHNRALARRRGGGGESWQIVPDLLRAIELIERPAAQAIPDRATLLAAAWTSLAEAQLAEPTEDAWRRAGESAAHALDLLGPVERALSTAATVGEQARAVIRRAACR